MNPQDFYRTQSEMSDPGEYSSLFDALPNDLTSLCRAVRNIYIHYMSGSAYNYEIPPDRMIEVDTRRTDLILKRVIELDSRPLSEKRQPQDRVVGCCRDASLLLCSMLRHKGIPARTRAGFARYINIGTPGFMVDHVVVEVWDGSRWKLVDPEQNETLIRENHIAFDVQDIPRDQFLVGGLAWSRCRGGQEDASNFGAHPDETFWRGLWAIRSRMVQDIAMLNKTEHLLWDDWGLTRYEPEPTEDDLRLLDCAADLAINAHDDANFEEILALYEDERLHAPRSFMSYSPAQEPQQVNL